MDTLLVSVLFMCVFRCSDAFNLDTENPQTFNGSQEDFFGYSVYQYHSNTEHHIIVAAPLTNSTEKLYNCSSNLFTCTALQPGSESISSVDLSVAVSSSASSSITSCSPFLAHECDGNSYLNGLCYQYNSSLQPVSNFTTGFQECTKRDINLVFMFDGSASMKTEEFELNKRFILNITKKLSNSSIKFAAVQFSKTFSVVFDFNDYTKGLAEKKLLKEIHMKSLTNTHHAIHFTLNKLLNNVSSGANPNATKALVIITDGDPTDDDDDINVLNKTDKQNILRYIIGVGDVGLTNLRKMASEPKSDNTFYIHKYAGLQGLLDDLQKKIYNIEGSQEAHGRDRQNELSQSGFSVLYHTDGSVIVGSVGSNDWRGVLYEVRGSAFSEIKDPAVNKDSYMGYSSAIGRRGSVSLLFSGAPRAEHMGQVTLFTQTGNTWSVNRSITGDQIGSYFGASLCVLDVDSDGESDFLLVGAPLYHRCRPRTEGRLYVYSLSQSLENMLNVCESNAGRFAASLASLQDLNGDGLSDVAVGAPLEDDWTGVVYIYLGDKTHGINTKTSPQRISGRSVLPGLQQFGVSVVGQMDMNDDNLTDVVIGARGGIILLKARPVMSVSPQLSFSPKEISIHNFECSGAAGDSFEAFNLTSCFHVSERTSSRGSLDKDLNVTLNINVDVLREMNRGFFTLHDPTSRRLQKSVQLSSNRFCSTFSVFMPRCISDTASPLKIRMNFSQTGNSLALLDIRDRTEEFVEVPFEKSCNSNNSCVADLRLDFSFNNKTLLLVNQAYFTVLITLINAADDSYNTSIVMHYPEGLSFSKLDTVKPSRTSSRCGDQDSGATNRTTCSISLPVYRSGTTTRFLGMFRVTNWDYDWPDMIDMIITANSDNNGNTTDATVKKSVAIQFAVELAISLVGEYSVTFLNFSLEDMKPKPLSIIYKVENVGVIDVPVSVTLNVTCETEHVKITPQSFSMSKMQCKKPDAGPCGRFECSEFLLKRSEVVEFTLTAEASLYNMKDFQSTFSFHEFRTDFVFDVVAQLNFNRSRYNQTTAGLKHDPLTSQTAVRVEFVVSLNRLLIGCIGAVGGLILIIIILVLLLKCGFFKRNRPDSGAPKSIPFEVAPLMNDSTKDKGEKEVGDEGKKVGDGGKKFGDGGKEVGDGGEGGNEKNVAIENGVKETSLTSEGPNTKEP